MLKSLMKLVAALGVLTIAAQAAAASYPGWARVRVAPGALPGRLVAAHNAVRAAVGTQPLAWDAGLAAGAGHDAPRHHDAGQCGAALIVNGDDQG